jgi:F-type H+-transporting ATPase subunit alpha
MEILKQPQYRPLSVEKQVLIVYAGNNGFLDQLPLSEAGRYEGELFRFLEARKPALLRTLAEKKTIDDALKADVEAALKEFAGEFKAAAQAV